MANPLAAIIAKRVAGKVATTAGKTAGAASKASKAGAQASKSTAKAGSSTAKAGANAGRGMQAAAKSSGKFKKFLGLGGAGGGLFGLGSLFDMFGGGDEAAAGEAVSAGGGASTPTPSSTATGTSTGLMLFDFASMLDNKMMPVPKLPEVVINEADLPYVDATLDADVAIPYDIEKMFKKERGSLIIPKDTFIDFSSDKIKGLTTAVLRLAKNQDLINQQIGILNNKTAALEQAIETAQDLNRRAILDYNRQQDEEALESGAPGTGEPESMFAGAIENAKTAAKAGLMTALVGAAGAAVAIGGTLLNDWFSEPEQEADQAYQDALAAGATEEEAQKAYDEALASAEDESWADEVAGVGGAAIVAGAGYKGVKAAQKGAEKLAASKVGQKVGMKTAAQKKAAKEIAEAGGRMMATEFGEAGTKKIGQEVGEAAGKKVGKSAITAAISKVAPKKMAGLAGKTVPGISWLVGGAIAVAQLAKGDYAGASLTAASSVAGGLTAIPLVTVEIAREVYNAVYGNPEGETTYEQYPHEWDAANPGESGYVEKIGVIKDAAAEWVAEWFESNAEYPQDEESLKSAIEKGIYDHDYVGDSEVDLSRVSELTVPEMKAIIAEDDIDDETKEVLQKQISTREEQVKPQPVEEVGGLKVGSVDRPSELRGKEIGGTDVSTGTGYTTTVWMEDGSTQEVSSIEQLNELDQSGNLSVDEYNLAYDGLMLAKKAAEQNKQTAVPSADVTSLSTPSNQTSSGAGYTATVFLENGGFEEVSSIEELDELNKTGNVSIEEYDEAYDALMLSEKSARRQQIRAEAREGVKKDLSIDLDKLEKLKEQKGETAIFNSASDARKAGEKLGGAFRIVPIEDEDGDDTGQYAVTAINSKSSADIILTKPPEEKESNVVVVPMPVQSSGRRRVQAEPKKPPPIGSMSKSQSHHSKPTVSTKDSWLVGTLDQRS